MAWLGLVWIWFFGGLGYYNCAGLWWVCISLCSWLFVVLGFACGVGLFGLLLFGFWCLGVRRCVICVASVCCACLLLFGVGWFWAVWLLARCCGLCLCLVWFGCAVGLVLRC